MCAVSVLSQHYGNRPRESWTPDTYTDYLRLKRKFEHYDERTNQPHCEDPRKETWMREVEQRLREKYDFVPKRPKRPKKGGAAVGKL